MELRMKNSRKVIVYFIIVVLLSAISLQTASALNEEIVGPPTAFTAGGVLFFGYSEVALSWLPSTNQDIVHGYGHIVTVENVLIPRGYMGVRGSVYEDAGSDQYILLAVSSLYFNNSAAISCSNSAYVATSSGTSYCGEGYAEVYDSYAGRYIPVQLYKSDSTIA